MHKDADDFREIWNKYHHTEPYVEINGVTYGPDYIISLKTSNDLLGSESKFSIGGTTSGQLDLEMILPDETIPRMAKIVVKLKAIDDTGATSADSINKGTYYIDTRKIEDNEYYGTIPDDSNKYKVVSKKKLTIHGYDSMLKAEQYLLKKGSSTTGWPKSDIEVVADIATKIGVGLHESVTKGNDNCILTGDFDIPFPGYEDSSGYTCRNLLSYIASIYFGSFYIDDDNNLKLVTFGELDESRKVLGNNEEEGIAYSEETDPTLILV